MNPQDGAGREAELRAQMGSPTLHGKTVDAPAFRRTDVSGRPSSNKMFTKVLAIGAVALVGGVFVITQFSGMGPKGAHPQASPTPVQMSESSSSDPSQDTHDADEEKHRLFDQTRARRGSDYRGAVSDLDAEAAKLDANGNPLTPTGAPTIANPTGAVPAGTVPMPASPTVGASGATQVAPDGSNLGAAGRPITSGVVTADVAPGSSGVGSGGGLPGVGGFIARPVSLAQAKLSDRAAAEAAARTGGLRTVAMADVGEAAPAATTSVERTNVVPTEAQYARDRAAYIAQVTAPVNPSPRSTNPSDAPIVVQHRETPFYLAKGDRLTVIPDADIRSDNASVLIKAHIPEDFRDHRLKRYLIIPHDTIVLLKAESAGLGASRPTVCIARMEFPNGDFIDFDGCLTSSAADGSGGMDGARDDHRGRVFSAAALTAALASIPIIAAGGTSTGVTTSATQIVGGQVATNITNAGSKIIETQLQQAPSFVVPAGKIQGIVLDRDLAFQTPYSDKAP